MNDKKHAGIVKWFNKDKGFGFITPDGGGKDVFVHTSNIAPPARALQDGQRVEFETSMGKKGPEAINVKPL